MGRERSAIIIGGGVIGVTSAYALAREGWKVRVFDRHQRPGMGASYGNGRQLSYSHTNALASPAILRKIPGLLLGCDPAFRLTPSVDPKFLGWVRLFLKNCTGAAYERNTLETLALAKRSQRAMRDMLGRHSIDFGHKQNGKLVLVRSEKELHSARAMVQSKQSAGLTQQVLTPEEVLEREPALALASEPFAGAVFSPDDAVGDCQRFTEELLALSIKQYGVQFEGAAEVTGLANQPSGPRLLLKDGTSEAADLIVIANAHKAPSLVAPLGHKLPIIPMKGYSFTAPAGNAAPKISITDSKRRIVFTNLGSRVLVAGIAEIGATNGQVDEARLNSMAEAARASLPEAAVYSRRDQGWAGFRPMTPNSQPIIRMLEPGIAVNSGHGMLGWTLAMGSAERLLEVVKQAN